VIAGCAVGAENILGTPAMPMRLHWLKDRCLPAVPNAQDHVLMLPEPASAGQHGNDEPDRKKAPPTTSPARQ